MNRKVVPLLATLAVGIAIGAIAIAATGLAGDNTRAALPAPEPLPRLADSPFDPARYAQIVDSLSELVNLEVAERRRLEVAVQELSDQLRELKASLEEKPDEKLSAAETAEAKRTQARNIRRNQGTDEERLQRFVDAGFSPERAAQLLQQQDAMALDRLFLRDEATRDGWANTERYREALGELTNRFQGLRQELGDEDYDRYLYAIGRPNRVLTRSVLSGGPAEQAGLQPGDAIISYGGERVFDSRSIVTLSGGGTRGTTTPIEIERDGERMVLYIPRGPLGVNMNVRNVRPEG